MQEKHRTSVLQEPFESSHEIFLPTMHTVSYGNLLHFPAGGARHGKARSTQSI